MTSNEFSKKKREFQRQIKEGVNAARYSLTLNQKLRAIERTNKTREEFRQFILNHGLEIKD